MRLLLITAAVIVLLPLSGFSQLSDIVAAEYFFDSDPGVGAATALPPFTANPNLDVTFLAASSSLSQGMHILGIRVKDNTTPTNLWSIPVYLPVYILANSPTISGAEYFFDTDPGSGNAIPISVTAGATIDVTFAANSSALLVGMHVMGVRTRNLLGNWSIPAYVPFYIDRSRTITKLEYSFDTDPGIGNGTAIVVSPSTDLLDQVYSMNSSALALGTHTLYTRVAGQINFWSMTEVVSFSVIAVLPPTITSFTPSSGLIGTTVIITGTNFDPVPANNTVQFNGTLATATASTTTSITTTVPVGATTGPITVTVVGNTATSATNFTVTVCPTAPTVVPDQGCQNTTVTLGASGGTNGQYRWYTLSTGGTAIAGEVNGTYTTPILSTTTTYFVSINDGACESARTSVIATIIALPTPPLATDTSICSGTAATLTASGGANGQYKWYTVATGGTAITGEANSSYSTPALTATTIYYVTLTISGCESTRTAVTASIVNTSAPTTTGASVCTGGAVTLTAAGGTNGQYKWYSVATGGTAIPGEVNSAYQITSLTATSTYYVSIVISGCESARTPATATILATGCAPVITAQTLTTQVEGKIEIDLKPLITTPGTLDPNSIKVIGQPSSGASASIANGILTIDYKGKPFSGSESILIEACNTNGICSQQTFSIEVAGDIIVYNAVSPNGDDKNPILRLEYIDILASTRTNIVSIYNRWGDEVFSISDYDNKTRVFAGLTNDGSKLPAGTYFYKIILPDAGKTVTGFISLKY